LYCPEDCGGRPSFCGNGVVEGKEQCDDGNNEDGDGCSKICILVAEPIRHSTIRVQQLPVGSLNQSLGSDDVTLLAFDVAAGRQDAYMTGVRFKSTAGTLADAQNYRLYADMSGDGKANTLISSVSSQDEILAFTDLHIFVQQGVARRVELKADLTSTASSTSLSVGFDTSDPQYVLAVGAVDGRELTGITTDADECDESMCWIAVYTLDSTGTISIIDRGNLYVTADSVPVKSRQVRAGELSPVLLRIKFRSDGEDIEIRDMAIAGGNDYIDYLDLFEEGSSTQFARARALTCDSPAAGVLCSKPNLIVKSGEEKSILVKAFIRSDSPDEVSGNSFALYLTTGTSPEPAVEARGKSSNETLDQNDGDQNAEGEIFIGTSSVGANATVTGPTHDMVASNIISITNAHDDANGMSVPLGNVVIGAFNFSASEKNSITSNPVHIKNIQFSVNATNVQVDSNSFEVINTNNSDDALTCSASDNTGDITVTCSNIDSSSVASTVNQGSNIMLGLKVNVTDSQVGNGSSTLQVSLRNLGSRSQTGTVEWDDDQTTFDWVDVEDNRVESTRYFNN